MVRHRTRKATQDASSYCPFHRQAPRSERLRYRVEPCGKAGSRDDDVHVVEDEQLAANDRRVSYGGR